MNTECGRKKINAIARSTFRYMNVSHQLISLRELWVAKDVAIKMGIHKHRISFYLTWRVRAIDDSVDKNYD